MPSLRVCALRNSECVVCLEPYGIVNEGIQVEPVILKCGHDLCEGCSEKVRSECPMCRQKSSSRIRKPFVDYLKVKPVESSSEKEATKQDVAALHLMADRMFSFCDVLFDPTTDQLAVSGNFEMLVRLLEGAASKLHSEDGQRKAEAKARSCRFAEEENRALKATNEELIREKIYIKPQAHPQPQPQPATRQSTPPKIRKSAQARHSFYDESSSALENERRHKSDSAELGLKSPPMRKKSVRFQAMDEIASPGSQHTINIAGKLNARPVSADFSAISALGNPHAWDADLIERARRSGCYIPPHMRHRFPRPRQCQAVRKSGVRCDNVTIEGTLCTRHLMNA